MPYNPQPFEPEIKAPMQEMVGHLHIYPDNAPLEQGLIRALVTIAGTTGIVYVPAYTTATRWGGTTLTSVCAFIEERAGAYLTAIRLL